MTQDELKQAVAHAAIRYVVDGEIVGVGTGSTANFFIDALGEIRHRIKGAVASSEATAARLAARGVPVFDLNEIDQIPVYIDGADEIDHSGAMIKGGGGALTREKIVASVAEKFICIADQSKLVDVLGKYPLPVEVIPMATSSVTRSLRALGGDPMASFSAPPIPPLAEPELPLEQAWRAPQLRLPLAEASGRLAAEPLCPYPPGIPLLIPGERIDADRAAWLVQQQQLWPGQIADTVSVVAD